MLVPIKKALPSSEPYIFVLHTGSRFLGEFLYTRWLRWIIVRNAVIAVKAVKSTSPQFTAFTWKNLRNTRWKFIFHLISQYFLRKFTTKSRPGTPVQCATRYDKITCFVTLAPSPHEWVRIRLFNPVRCANGYVQIFLKMRWMCGKYAKMLNIKPKLDEFSTHVFQNICKIFPHGQLENQWCKLRWLINSHRVISEIGYYFSLEFLS